MILGIGLSYLLTGILADILGRKRMLMITSILIPITQILPLMWAMQLIDRTSIAYNKKVKII